MSSLERVKNAQLPVSGPKGWPVVGCLPDFYSDPLGFLTHAVRQHGDICRIEIVGLPYYQLSDPGQIYQVLTQYKMFRKGSVGRERRRLFGNGLATAEGEFWLQQRHLSQPAFSRERLNGYGQIMASIAVERTSQWPISTHVDLHELLMRLTLESISRVLFGVDVNTQARQVGQSLEYAMNFFGSQASFVYHLLPKWFMTPGRRRFHAEIDKLDAIVEGIVREGRNSGEDRGDLLSTLLRARDEADNAMDDQQLRDELMTMFLAGHETTALALSWTFALLSQHPEAETRLQAEVNTVLGGRHPTVEDLPNLVYTEQLLKEAMRVYPPAWILARQALEDVDVGGVVIPKRAFVTMSQWVTHRDPRFFNQPEQFQPERWTPSFEKSLPKSAYFPFGAGPRGCIGKALAMMEAKLFLACIIQQFQFEPDPGFRLDPAASLSLRPRHGLPGRLVPRTTA